MESASVSQPRVDPPFHSAANDRLIGVRVALFTGKYNYVKDGANQALNRLVDHLEQRAGAQVRVYSPVTDTPAFAPVGTLVPVRSVPLPGRPEFRLALGLPRVVRDDVRAFAPDIVHIATPDILGMRAQTFAKAMGVPVVASLHTHFERYCDYYRLGRLRPIVEAHLRRFYGRSDLILAPSPATASEMAATHGADRLALWSRGVETDLFAPTRRSAMWRAGQGIGESEVAVLFFGRLVLEKGVDCFADTIARLRAQGLPVRPVVIGEGPARDRMRAALPDAVFTGHLQGLPLAIAVASCDVMINPSMTETFGNVTLEAMASGLAVVAADVASTHNLIDHGVNGLISAPHPAIYAHHATQAIGDAELRRALGEAAHGAAQARTWDVVLDGVLESYATVLARAKP